jgi:hypothetical protein
MVVVGSKLRNPVFTLVLATETEKAQLAPGFPTIRVSELPNTTTVILPVIQINFVGETLEGRNGPAMMASGIITSKYSPHVRHLTDWCAICQQPVRARMWTICFWWQ